MSTQTEFESKNVLKEKINRGCQTENQVFDEVVQTALRIPPATDIFQYFPLLPGHSDYDVLMKKSLSGHSGNVLESKVLAACPTPKVMRENIDVSSEKVEHKKVDCNTSNAANVSLVNHTQKLKLHQQPTQSAAKVHSNDTLSELFSKMRRFSDFYR